MMSESEYLFSQIGALVVLGNEFQILAYMHVLLCNPNII